MSRPNPLRFALRNWVSFLAERTANNRHYPARSGHPRFKILRVVLPLRRIFCSPNGLQRILWLGTSRLLKIQGMDVILHLIVSAEESEAGEGLNVKLTIGANFFHL